MSQHTTNKHNPLTELSMRERIFAHHYAETAHKTNSAMAIGTSQIQARVVARRMLQRKRVQEAILYLRDQKDHAHEITQDRLIAGLANIAEFDPGELYDFTEVPVMADDGSQAIDDQGNPMTRHVPKLRPLNGWTPSQRANISKIKFDKDGNIKELEFPSRLKAYDMLLKTKGAYISINVHEHTVTHTTDRLQRARDKARKEAEALRNGPVLIEAEATE